MTTFISSLPLIPTPFVSLSSTTLTKKKKTRRRPRVTRLTSPTLSALPDPQSQNTNTNTNPRPSLSTVLPSVLTSRTSLLPTLVPIVRHAWRTAWLVLMSQLAPSDSRGCYQRPSSSLSLSQNEKEQLQQKQHFNNSTIYAGYACPWCHRVTLAIALLNLSHIYNLRIVTPGDNGLWRLSPHDHHVDQTKQQLLKDVYLDANPSYSGRFTAPLLHDTTNNRLVSNESSDILSYFSSIHSNNTILLSQHHTQICVDLNPYVFPDVEQLSNDIHNNINDGVYRIGFATSQYAYNLACDALFQSLDSLELRLTQTKFLFSNSIITVADIKLFPTIFRFDSVYAPLFHISRKSIRANYPAISKWLRRIFHLPGVQNTCQLQQTVQQYFSSLFPINPSRIVPDVAYVDFTPLTEEEW